MNELINVLNQDGNLVVSSREVAKNFDKEHYHVVEAIENKIKNLTHEKSGVAQNWTSLFIESEFYHKGNLYKEYLLTRDGFSFIVMGFTGSKADAWKLKYIDAFNKMEEIIKKPLSQQEIMRIQLGMIDDHEARIDKLENTMTIDYGQQQALKKLVNARVLYLLGGKQSNAYREVSKKVFSECNRDIQDYFIVNSRNNIPKLKFEDAVDYIKNWQPSTNTRMMVNSCNAQMHI